MPLCVYSAWRKLQSWVKMDEERKTSKESIKSRYRNKRTSEVLNELTDSDCQNQPPSEQTQSFKRPKWDESAAGSSSHKNSSQMGPTVLKASGSDEADPKGELVTPAVLISASAAQIVPGAPRILLVNQQSNAELPQQVRLDASKYLQLLRTPPSAKNNRIYLGKENGEGYRGFDRFARVSDEIILRVFHYLPRHMMCTCALVCRRWARIVCDISLWRRMDMAGRPLKVGILKILLERGVEVLRLNRSEVMGDFSSTVQGAPDPRRSPLSEDRMYRLQMLDMSMANVKTSLVENMLKFCPNLRKISLENIPVTEQLLINIGVNSPYLEVLNLCMCVGVTAKGLRCIIENCTSLSQLNIAWTCMSDAEVKAVCRFLPEQLTALDFSGNREKMGDKDVKVICKRCPNLEDLDLSDSTEVSNVTVDVIREKLQYLQKISLSRCYGIVPNYIVNLTDLKELKVINIFGMMREATLTLLEQHMKRYKINKEPFSVVARPTTSNSRKVLIWNVSPRHGPCL